MDEDAQAFLNDVGPGIEENVADQFKDEIRKRVELLKEKIAEEFAYTAPEILKELILIRVDRAFEGMI